MREHGWDPGFNGSFSLKAVAPTLVPSIDYGSFEVGDGGAAATALETLLVRPHTMTPSARAATRKAREQHLSHSPSTAWRWASVDATKEGTLPA